MRCLGVPFFKFGFSDEMYDWFCLEEETSASKSIQSLFCLPFWVAILQRECDLHRNKKKENNPYFNLGLS